MESGGQGERETRGNEMGVTGIPVLAPTGADSIAQGEALGKHARSLSLAPTGRNLNDSGHVTPLQG